MYFQLCAPRFFFFFFGCLPIRADFDSHRHKSTEVLMWNSTWLFCIFCPDGACRAAPTQHSRRCHGYLQAAKEREHWQTDLDFSELTIPLLMQPENSKPPLPGYSFLEIPPTRACVHCENVLLYDCGVTLRLHAVYITEHTEHVCIIICNVH